MALPSGARLTRVIVGALGILAAACGAGAGTDASDPPPISVVATTSRATTEASPATTIATPVASTLPQPTAPSQTTGAPTTTTAATTADEAAVRAGFDAYLAGFDQCGLRPSECSVASFVASGSRAFDQLGAYFSGLATRGWYVVPSAATNAAVVERFDWQPSGQVAVTACVVDGSLLRDSKRTPDESDDATIDDTVTATRSVWVLSQTSDGWRVASSARIDTADGDKCSG
jgi:hypothetical protein